MKPNTWFWMPIVVVICSIIILSINKSPGLDGAAMSLVLVFWFLPTIIFLIFKIVSNLKEISFSKTQKILIFTIWIVPSIPLSIMSLMGIMILSEVSFGLLVRSLGFH